MRLGSPLKVVALAGLIIALLAPASVVADGYSPAGTNDATKAAEARMLEVINDYRAAEGLKPFRMWWPLRKIARERSADMIARDYYSHDIPGGGNVFDLLERDNVQYFSPNAQENIGWDAHVVLIDEDDHGNSLVHLTPERWDGSPGHRAGQMSNKMNYAGIGIAKGPYNGGTQYVITALYTQSADRTPPIITWTDVTLNGAHDDATLTWGATDNILQSKNTWIKNFEVSRKNGPNGSWISRGTTTSQSFSFSVWPGQQFNFRVRAKDNAGNVGDWKYAGWIYP